MLSFKEEYLTEVLARYRGPALIERLHLLTNHGGLLGAKASLAALKYLAKNNQYSPYIESFVLHLDALPESDEINRFRSPQWAQYLNNSQQNRLKDLGADNFYHETDVSKNIEIAQIYMYSKQYSECQSILSSSALSALTCQFAEQSAQVGILQGNLSLTLNQDKKIEAFISTSLSSELYLKRLTDREVISYWRVKFLILFAEFLKQSYHEVAVGMYELIRLPAVQTASGKQISAINILNESNFNSFVHKDEIILASVISILLTRQVSELNDVLAEQEFITLVGNRLGEFRPLFISLNSAKFGELFSLLDSYDPRSKLDALIFKTWDNVRLAFREKGYELYLSLILRVRSSYLSEKLAIPKQQLIKEVQQFIKKRELEFTYDEEIDIFEVNKIDKREIFLERLRLLAEETDTIEGLMREKFDKSTKPPAQSQANYV